MDSASGLVRLQEIDLELLRLRKQVDELPQKGRIAKLRKATKQVQGELTHIVGRRKDLEMDLADLDDERKQVSSLVDEAQLKAAEGDQDFRAITDLESQLTVYAKRLEKIDFDEQAASENLDQLLDRERQVQDWLERSHTEEETLISSYKQALAQTKTEMEKLLEERGEVARSLEPALVARYSDASKRFKGLAVETLNANKPSICRVALSPGQIQDLKGEGEVCTCPYCRRMLVVAGA